jgi:hypothetical protein
LRRGEAGLVPGGALVGGGRAGGVAETAQGPGAFSR